MIWRSSSKLEHAVFPGAIAEWTADQRKLIALQRELSGLFELISLKNVPMPPDDVLLDYHKLSKFREDVSNGKAAEKQQHTHGWRRG